MLKQLMAKRMHPLIFFAPPVSGLIAVMVIGYPAITRSQCQVMALLGVAGTSFVLQVISAFRNYRENQDAGISEGWLVSHHQRGLYELFCDDQANAHYEMPTTGLMYRLWRIRVYCRGFLSRI